MAKTSEIEELKFVYSEVVEGCSFFNSQFFVKHLCELEQIELNRKRIEFFYKYIKEGMPTEEERLIQLKASEEWLDEWESDILTYRQIISDNEKLLPTVISVQQPIIQKVIEENRKALIVLLTKRKILIGTTAEELSDRDAMYFLASASIFKDKELKVPMFSVWEEFEKLDEPAQDSYLSNLEKALEKIKESNIRKVSVLPFFLNPFSYCKEAPYTFLDRPVSRMTSYQTHLISLGLRNLNILSQSEGSPPECFDNVSIDDIVKWYDTQYSIIIGKRNRQAKN